MLLADLLAAAEGKPVQYQGLIVHGIVRQEIAKPAVVIVRRLQASESPVQGLRIKLDNGDIEVAGQRLRDVVLWANTAPDEVELSCVPKGQSATLKFWNVWRDENSTMQAWIGHAGILVERQDSRLLFRCSDGYAPVNFGDLVVEVAIEERSDESSVM
jgi:hypothetical protein